MLNPQINSMVSQLARHEPREDLQAFDHNLSFAPLDKQAASWLHSQFISGNFSPAKLEEKLNKLSKPLIRSWVINGASLCHSVVFLSHHQSRSPTARKWEPCLCFHMQIVSIETFPVAMALCNYNKFQIFPPKIHDRIKLSFANLITKRSRNKTWILQPKNGFHGFHIPNFRTKCERGADINVNISMAERGLNIMRCHATTQLFGVALFEISTLFGSFIVLT